MGEGRTPELARRLGLFDATMVVMGGIVGAGIFINPHVVAQKVQSPFLIELAWVLGGVMALLGAFVYADLAALRPAVGGQYAYIREAFHPMVAFCYGWGLLLVTQTGGMAAVAMTFAHYFEELTGLGGVENVVGTLALLVLTLVNCFGVRAGSNVQSALMVMKIVAIGGLVFCGFVLAPRVAAGASTGPSGGLHGLGAAMIPVVFAYGGWQTASFISGELRDPSRDLPRGLLLGVLGVIALYVSVSYVCVRALGPAALAASSTPASEVMRRALGSAGGRVIALGIAISTLGFLSQGILTAPRVYFAMARDGIFFERVGWLHPKTQAPVVAIVLQGIVAVVIALSNRYDQILNYVVSVDFIFFGLTGTALLVLRRREPGGHAFAMPGHPWTTALFALSCYAVALNTFVEYPGNTLIGAGILLSGIPVYLVWTHSMTGKAAGAKPSPLIH
jgi:APA family basic amino acid/polyamine antiporter